MGAKGEEASKPKLSKEIGIRIRNERSNGQGGTRCRLMVLQRTNVGGVCITREKKI